MLASAELEWGTHGLQKVDASGHEEERQDPHRARNPHHLPKKFLHSNLAPNLHPDTIDIIHDKSVKMSGQALNKIAPNSPSRQNPSELEQNIAQALYDLETNTADLKVALRPLQIVSAREVRCP